MTNEILRKIYRVVLTIALILLAVAIYFLFIYKPYYHRSKTILKGNSIEQKVTSNTVRIQGKTLYGTTVAITQVAYPSSFKYNRPNAVILVRDDKMKDAMLAARISHEPINAPILYTKKEHVPEETLKEIDRLKPEGIFLDGNTKIIVIGNVDASVLKTLDNRKLKYRHINGDNVFALSLNIDNYLAALNGDHRDAVIITSIENPQYALPQAAWSSHSGDGFFFIQKDKIPKEVEKALKNRHGKAYIYILGGQELILNSTEKQLSKYGHVQRIPLGNDVYSTSVGFASYKDLGKNFAWWIGKRPRDFGWGISEPGHNFIFVNPKQWQIAVTSTVLSHKGKHAPILLVQENEIPDVVKNYLQVIKPAYNSPQEHVYNSGWIIGSEDAISNLTQTKIDELLEISMPSFQMK
ncbi:MULTISPECIES: cell wall-binding repeat-containing protein [Clostridiaceae]|uniref:cell wall-binding repeat-containing protein n=1 Tax=Clostridiaceae TaxID=31979 RepID=UPI00054E74F9|nr:MULTISPECIES: cell wall-binding repeat-containing protein [Clostridiaceae]